MPLQEELEKQGVWLFRYRGTLPLVILGIGGLLYFQTELHPETFVLEDTPYEIYFNMACVFISLIGLGIRVYTVGHSPKNTSGRNVEGQVAETLNTTGIYSIVRHPLYLGNFFMWLGPALITGNFWFVIAFCLFYWIYYERIMFAEEQFLRKKFGPTYLAWAENVPAFLPNFSQFKKPNVPFSLKKVLKKEKNGLAAIFLIFCAFDIAGQFITHQTNYNTFLIVSCVVTFFLYFIIKVLAKQTTLLNETSS
jgi:protein-S-isoprenylcysteine O-methyltransferase Ste14